MRLGLPLILAALAACTSGATAQEGASPELGAPAPQQDPNDWTQHVQIEAKVEGPEFQLQVTPKAGWFINRAYPGAKLVLSEGSGALAPGAEIKATPEGYLEPKGEDKAMGLIFKASAEGAEPGGRVAGEYKIVICSPDTCSPPFKGPFSAAVPAS